MFCSNCGKEIRDNSNFCPYCGIVKRAIPSETVKQTPVQDTSVSVKKNGSKVFKSCPNCGKAIGENSAFCPYCGSAERAIPSKTVEQTPVQNTSVAAWQSRFKDFWKRKWSEDKQAVVVSALLVLSIVCIMVCGMIKRHTSEYINEGIEIVNNDFRKFTGKNICVKGWVGRLEEDWMFTISENPSSDSDWVIVDGRELEKIPERGTAVAVYGEWVLDRQFGGELYCLRAYKMDFLDEESSFLLEKYQTISATSLLKNPDTYIGKCVQVTGEVSQATSGAFMVGETTSASGVWVDGQVDKRHAVNGEQVTVYGVVTGGGDFTDIKIMLDVIEFAD